MKNPFPLFRLTRSKHAAILFVLFAVIVTACGKEDPIINTSDLSGGTTGLPNIGVFQTFTIQAGTHQSDQSKLTIISTSDLKFVARFDSSAVYSTSDTTNQSDINKLYGFSEGIDNQVNSARIGWCWLSGALRLYGYVYVNGVRYYQEIATVPIGQDINCSIRLSGKNYIFTVNNSTLQMNRGLADAKAAGLLQFPYFGGDENAPQKITIQIKNL